MNSFSNAEKWWSRFCRVRNPASRHALTTPKDRGIHDGGIALLRPVDTAEDLTSGRLYRDRLWRTQPAQRFGHNGALVEEFCWDGATGWRPWKETGAHYDSAPLSYRRCRNALLLVRSGLVMPRPMVVFRETRPDWGDLLEPLPGLDCVTDGPPELELEAAKPQHVIQQQVLSLCHVYGHGYGHWFCDALPPLLKLLPLVLEGRLPLAVPPLLPWQRRTLELLGVASRSIIEISEPTIACRDLICHSYGGKAHAIRSSSLVAEVYRRLNECRPREASAPRLIYVSRRSLGSWREFTNEKDVEDAFRRLGFVVLNPENMTLDEQMAAFSHAEVVAGPHGSALANAGFAPSGCLIMDMVPNKFAHHWIYGLARHLDHRLVVLVAERDSPCEDGREPKFFEPMRYRMAPEVAVERARAAMQHLAIRP